MEKNGKLTPEHRKCLNRFFHLRKQGAVFQEYKKLCRKAEPPLGTREIFETAIEQLTEPDEGGAWNIGRVIADPRYNWELPRGNVARGPRREEGDIANPEEAKLLAQDEAWRKREKEARAEKSYQKKLQGLLAEVDLDDFGLPTTLAWVGNHFEDKRACLDNAPSPLAWNMLVFYREAQRAFWDKVLAFMTSSRGQTNGDADVAVDDDPAKMDLLDRLEREGVLQEAEVGT